jgi:hypothetical protein
VVHSVVLDGNGLGDGLRRHGVQPDQLGPVGSTPALPAWAWAWRPAPDFLVALKSARNAPGRPFVPPLPTTWPYGGGAAVPSCP